ncbi:hypothetical protein LG201_09645 [Methylobacillus gramineus]|uniref:hypothetical protein n=1 Tax=Methylobacillus gramineus TaxID=755169 RepID=UPI001CFF72F6|nr:hypothetical protein [Methylobacillus gramineus]MCB5185463.1 hypothetical protein [Methylobacillus gramineus]
MKSFIQIWGMPIALAVLTGFGLLAALLATGIWHWLSWLSMSIPLMIVWRAWRKASPS